MVGIHPNLRWEIEGDGKACLAFAEEITVALIGFDGGAEARVLTHSPETAAVHCGVDSTRVWQLSRIAERVLRIPIGKISFGVKAFDGKAGESREFLLALGGCFGFGV